MNNRVICFFAIALAAFTSTAMAQTSLVPAIPGAPIIPPVTPAPGSPPALTPEQIAAQMQDIEQRTALAKQAADQATASSQQMQAAYEAAQAGRSTGVAQPGQLATATLPPGVRPESIRHLQPVRPGPSDDDIAQLRRQLDGALAQRRAERVTDDGTLAATAASSARSAIVFPYVPEALYEIYAAPDHMTTIELQPGEFLTTPNGKPKAADTVQWIADTTVAGEGASRRVIVLIKPTMSGIETNMLIPTNRHIYNFVLRSVSRAYMPVVDFDYPPEDTPTSQPTTPQGPVVDAHAETIAAATPDGMRFNYRIKGARVVWSPIRVFDDGSKTYLQMSPEMHSWEAPALFVMEDKKTPLLVNYRVKGDYYIVDRLFDHAQLRIGAKQVVNVYRLAAAR
jgi:type IV secretion system protein VirB9